MRSLNWENKTYKINSCIVLHKTGGGGRGGCEHTRCFPLTWRTDSIIYSKLNREEMLLRHVALVAKFLDDDENVGRKNSIAISPSSLPMRPRARLNLIPNLLSPQKTLKQRLGTSLTTAKKCTSVQSCYFANINLSLFCRSRCRRCRRCLSSLLL